MTVQKLVGTSVHCSAWRQKEHKYLCNAWQLTKLGSARWWFGKTLAWCARASVVHRFCVNAFDVRIQQLRIRTELKEYPLLLAGTLLGSPTWRGATKCSNSLCLTWRHTHTWHEPVVRLFHGTFGNKHAAFQEYCAENAACVEGPGSSTWWSFVSFDATVYSTFYTFKFVVTAYAPQPQGLEITPSFETSWPW